MKIITIPRIEVLAALRQSLTQAKRDNLNGCAEQVQRYVDYVEASEVGDVVALGEGQQVEALVRQDDAVWSLRLELTERRETLENRAKRARENSHAWHQLQGQLLELDRIMYRLADLPQ